MRVTTVIEAMALSALLVGTAAAGVKYVAVVETDVDASSGASDELKPAEVREITAELRRQATENLPRDKYSVMTSETVQSMGGAVLEECAEENCVIALGSRIGADYIVRGTVSKFQTMFTLAIELYETENGTLVVSSEAVRSENLVELLKMAKAASAEMFKKFASIKGSARKSEPVTINGRKHDYYIAPKYQFPVGTPISWGGVNIEGGLVWKEGLFLGIDLNFGLSDIEVDTNSNLLAGLGISLGNVYNLGEQLRFVYGGSVGFWLASDFHYEYKGYDAEYWAVNYLAPFVKLRWNFVELTYRGLWGLGVGKKEVHYGNKTWDKDLKIYDYDNSDHTSFNWNNHQLMLGLYFATNKRTR